MSTRPTVLPPAGATDVLYLVDFSGYVFRAYHAIAPLTSARGEPTHATYGFTAMLHKLLDERKPVYLGVAVDAPGPRVRTEIDARYKANRPPPPDDLIHQLNRSREIVEAYDIPIFSAPGFEADDLIAVAVARARAQGLRVVIASSDKDLMQLVDDEHVVMWDAMRDRVYGRAEVITKFGVPPEQLRDLLALVGDTSDNVPGVPSIGQKTAAELLAQFGSLDALYQRLDEVKRERTRTALRENEAEARLSLELVTLHAELPLDLDLDKLRRGQPNVDRLREMFSELGFTRFLKTLPQPSVPAVQLHAERTIVSDEAGLRAIAERAESTKLLAIEIEGSSTEGMRAAILGLALASPGAPPAYVPIGHRYLGVPSQVSLDTLRAVLGPVLANTDIAKVGHDMKHIEVVLRSHGMTIEGITLDTMLASYLMDPEASNALDYIAERDASVKLAPLEAGAKKRGQARAFDEIEVEQAAKFAAPRAEIELALASRYRERLVADKLAPLLDDLELPLARVLAEMELTGVMVDFSALGELGAAMTTELAALEKKAYEAVGKEFNVASPKQLETILFDELGLKATKKTKSGRSTDAEVLETLVDDHALPQIVLEHRAIAKLKGTYVDALPKLVHPKTGRIHTEWSQAVAATGRISSKEPNLQNIPVRTELGRMIRKAFVAPKGMVFLSADYSQIELRVLAHLSKDPVLVDAFVRGQDVHARTAMEIFRVDEAGVTDEMRRRSKTVNFGVIYGMGESALAKRLGISRQEAAKFIDAYFDRYKGVAEFMESTMREARKTDAVLTLLGRRRLLPDLRNPDRMRRAYAERIAQNTPIQGSAADILKLAMVHLKEPIVPGARMVLTVHDELGFEVPEDRADEAKARVKQRMEEAMKLDVPLVVDAGYGATWAAAK